VTGDVLVRPSRESDVPAIAAIYAHHVLHGTATFETDPPKSQEMARRRLALVERAMPHLVAELSGDILGYAYAGPYRPREAYRFTLEDSIYIHRGHRGCGIGRQLLAAVIEASRAGGWRQIVAVIGDSANTASIRLHQSAGFRPVGVLYAVGFKFDRWLDTVLMQLPLTKGD
jgi:L-amino acid N-acyltransferase YncA